MERTDVNKYKIIKPNVDVSLCKICNKMTDKWYTKWPKEDIVWMCEKCMEKMAKENRKQVELILEKMCDEC